MQASQKNLNDNLDDLYCFLIDCIKTLLKWIFCVFLVAFIKCRNISINEI